MSLKYFSSDSVPAQTARVAFPKGNIYDDADFESLFYNARSSRRVSSAISFDRRFSIS